MLWKIQTPGGLNHGTRQKTPKSDGNGVELRFFLVALKSMEIKNKAAASAQSAKGGKRLQRKPPDGWSAVGPWNQTSILR